MIWVSRFGEKYRIENKDPVLNRGMLDWIDLKMGVMSNLRLRGIFFRSKENFWSGCNLSISFEIREWKKRRRGIRDIRMNKGSLE